MKNFKQNFLQLGLILYLIGFGFNANAQQQENPNAQQAVISQDVDKPGGGNSNPPAILSNNELINDLIEIEVYPNPNNGSFNVKINDKTDIDKIVITDLTGNIIFKQSVKELLDDELIINLSNMKKGIYILSTGKSVHKFKVI